MEEKRINIAEIISCYPKGTKLYSPLFGDVELVEVNLSKKYAITVKTLYNEENATFFFDGRYYRLYGGECLLFPSSSMRDWSKFFKRGDFVINRDRFVTAVFDRWTNDDYTEFRAIYSNDVNCFTDGGIWKTSEFDKATGSEALRFIAYLNKQYHGKYNPDTLEVEPTKQKCKFKPFDKVLVRDHLQESWRPAFFAWEDKKREKYPFGVANGGANPSFFRYCIPFNERTAHLVGTNLPYKEEQEGGDE